MTDIASRVLTLTRMECGREATRESTFEQLDLDSLDVLTLVMALEDEFEIEVPDDDAETLTTVEQAITYIEGRLS